MRLAAVLALTTLAALAPVAAHGADRYSLAGGCYTLNGAGDAPVADQVRLKATALGRYLLYTKDGAFITAQGDGTLAPAAAPSPAADFAIQESGDALTLAPQSTKTVVATVTPVGAGGCAEFPEAGLNATGTPSRGATEYGRVGGIVEGHMHWMAYQYFGGHFRCGKPWDPYGITFALPDCADNEGPQGT
jgi:hypothetical protein